MINSKLFNIGDICYALLLTPSAPDIVMRIRCKILDIRFDHKNPKYKVKILDLLEDWDFCKHYIVYGNFRYQLATNNAKESRFVKFESRLNSKEDLMNLIGSYPDKKFALLVDSFHCVNTEKELNQLSSRVMDIIMFDKLREFLKTALYNKYKGSFSIPSEHSIRKIYKDIFPLMDDELLDAVLEK